MNNTHPPNARPEPNYRIVDERSVYEASWKGVPYAPWPAPEDEEAMALLQYTGQSFPYTGPWVLNWIVRRQPCVLVSGDLPRFALEETERIPVLNPPLQKMSDIRLRVRVGEHGYWLDEIGAVTTRYSPWGTEHRVDLRPMLPLSVHVTATMAENRGVIVRVNIAADGSIPDTARFEAYTGGMRRHEPTAFPPFFTIPEREEDDETIVVDGNKATLSDPVVPFRVRVTAEPYMPMAIATQDLPGKRVVSSWPLREGSQSFTVLLEKIIEGTPPLSATHFDNYLRDTKMYFDTLLDTIDIDTPDRVLNAGFYAAAVTLECAYQPPGWLEGLHGWNVYYNNCYQISSAIVLGQFDRAREALRTFIHKGEALGIYLSDASLWRLPDGSLHHIYDGVPYYVLQLHRYWVATDDRETLDDVWDALVRSFEGMCKLRDQDGDGVFDFHFACNAYLYQADNLSLPGSAFSPTVMHTGTLELMAEMAEARGETKRAALWRSRAAYLRHEIVRRFWLPDEGRFAAGIDTQGFTMRAAFYTDYVFPQLYSSLPAEYTHRSLCALDRTLWEGEYLIRVGNFKPPVFGNDMVAPVQVSEAAEAYFRGGRADRGWALLHGAALAATVLTDAPGLFPEQISHQGWALPNVGFSNPAAAYLHATAAGLFGVEHTVPTRILHWQPTIPAAWERAHLRLGGMTASIAGAAGDRRYEITLPAVQEVELRVPLYGHRLTRVTDDAGRPLGYRITPHPAGDFATIQLAPAARHAVWVISTAGSANPDAPAVAVQLKAAGPLFLKGERRPVVFDNLFNAHYIDNQIISTAVRFDFSSSLEKSLLIVGDTTFAVRENGRNLIRLEIGQLDWQTNRLISLNEMNELKRAGNIANVPAIESVTDAAIIPIGRAVQGLELLTAAHIRTRLTDMTVAVATLRYADGTTHDEPLTFGRQIDDYGHPCADGVAVRRIGKNLHVAAATIPADQTRELRAVELRVIAFDTCLGVFAMNTIQP